MIRQVGVALNIFVIVLALVVWAQHTGRAAPQTALAAALPLAIRPPFSLVPPTPPPTVTPALLMVLPNDSYYIDAQNYLNVYGEVYNATGKVNTQVRIIAFAFNSNGSLVGQKYNDELVDPLPIRERGCFHIALQQPTNWSYYELQITNAGVSGARIANLAVLNLNGFYDATDGSFTICGEIRSDDLRQVTNVGAVGTIYDRNDRVIGCRRGLANSVQLSPGQTSTFSLNFSERDYAEAWSYRVVATGGVP